MPEFPATSLLTEFAGSPENPLSEGGKWAEYGRFPLQKMGPGSVTPTMEFFVNGMYWTVSAFRSPCEVFACVGGGGLGAANESWRVCLWKDDPTAGVGYMAAFGGGIGEDYFMRRYDGGFNNFVGIAGVDTTNPEKIGLRITNTDVEEWAYFSGDWHLLLTVPDTTYRGTFFAAIEMEEQGSVGNVSMGCFGGGVINRQHIYRILRGKQGVPA